MYVAMLLTDWYDPLHPYKINANVIPNCLQERRLQIFQFF